MAPSRGRESEARSFAPVEPRAVKIDPITSAKPTNAELAKGFNQIHACLEDHKESTEANFTELKDALGISAGRRTVAGLSSPLGAFWRTTAASGLSFGGLWVAYKFCVVNWPTVSAFIHALNDSIIAGKL